MVPLEVKIEMAGPFLVSSRKLGTVSETLDYLPGSVLRGVVAETLLRDGPEESRHRTHPDDCLDRTECAFCQLFFPQVGPLPRFGNLYPTSGDVAYPFPATARSCKHHPGFRRDDYDPDERHGILDILIRQCTFEQALDSNGPLPFVYRPECPRCRARGKLVEAKPVSSSFYSLVGDSYQATEIYRRRLSRTAISRRRGAAEEELLFTLNVLSEQMNTDFLDEDGVPIKEVTTLRGRVWVGDARVEAMRSALQRVERIGAVRSRGMGRVARIESTPASPVKNESLTTQFLEQAVAGKFILPARLKERDAAGEPLRPKSLAERLIAFNVRFQAERDLYAKLDVPPTKARWHFTVNLLSDAILTDEGLPTLRLTPQMLGLEGNDLPEVELERSFVGHAYRSGWSGAHRLPRQVRLAVPMGGVYLYNAKFADQDRTARLLEKLEHLEQVGLGLDRERGYGQVMVCLPFHLEVEAR